MANIIGKKTLYSFSVYIDGILHLSIPVNKYSGIQSWVEGDNVKSYFIEYYLTDSKSIVCEYEDKCIWEKILKEIENVLI